MDLSIDHLASPLLLHECLVVVPQVRRLVVDACCDSIKTVQTGEIGVKHLAKPDGRLLFGGLRDVNGV
jgi:hypothetical protein